MPRGFPHQAIGPVISELVSAAREGHKERSTSIPVYGDREAGKNSWLLKPRRVAIALTADGSALILKFEVADGVDIDVSVQKDDIQKLQQALETTAKRLEDLPDEPQA